MRLDSDSPLCLPKITKAYNQFLAPGPQIACSWRCLMNTLWRKGKKTNKRKTEQQQNHTPTEHRPLFGVRIAFRINTTLRKPKHQSRHEDRFEQKSQLELQYKISTALFYQVLTPQQRLNTCTDFLLILHMAWFSTARHNAQSFISLQM